MPISDYLKHLRSHIGTELILMPAVAAFVFNDAGEVLLQKRADNGLWGMPGGAIDPGEDASQAVVREAYEETGLLVKPERLIATIRHPYIYPNGDELEVHIACFRCKQLSGELQALDGESLELRYFATHNLPSSSMLEPYPKELFDVNYEGAYFAWDDSFLGLS